ncbi:MAG: IPTL-CTERM sorting domain-containing protein, partial [Candidatus Contendobacter sp.]|nr:IPTL-CTERM sorting domain-containing protein [Candidatus Contendobacter sp.]
GVGGGGAGSNFTANGGGGGGGGFGGGGGPGVGSSNGGFGGGGGGGFGVGIGGVGGFGGGSGAFGSSTSGAGGGGAGLGGAVFSMYGSVTAVNSTVTGNRALGGAGYGGGSGHGGGLFNLDGTVTLTNVTLAANQVQAGAGTLNGSATGGAVYSLAHANRPDGGPVTATLTLTNSILAGSTDGTNPVSDLIVNLDQSRNNPSQTNSASVAFTLNGGASTNLVQSFTAIGSPTQTGAPTLNTDPQLGALANNGGLTQTMALLAGSPAINAGTNAGCPATDQRGITRPQPSGGACDLGAYELLLTTTVLVAAPSPAALGQTVALTATVSPTAATGTVSFQEGGSPLTCAEGAQPRPLSSSSATCTVTGGFGIGPHAFTADYSSDNGYAPSQGTTNLTVNQATTTAITSDTPDPSAVGQAIPVNFTVTPVGGGTPTGNVTVSDGTVNCIGTVAAGTCNLTPTSAGTKTLTATYAGDGTFNGSVSAGEPHEVLATTAQGNAGGGLVTAALTGGTCIGFANGTTSFPVAPTPLPPGVIFPYGLFGFTAVCPTGGTITLTMTYPNPLPPDTQYWKYGPTAGDPSNHWYVLPATLAGNTATFTITDGGLGDDDLVADGDIVDQGGPGVPPNVGNGATGIPTLGEWALLLFSALFGSLLWRTRRRGG